MTEDQREVLFEVIFGGLGVLLTGIGIFIWLNLIKKLKSEKLITKEDLDSQGRIP